MNMTIICGHCGEDITKEDRKEHWNNCISRLELDVGMYEECCGKEPIAYNFIDAIRINRIKANNLHGLIDARMKLRNVLIR